MTPSPHITLLLAPAAAGKTEAALAALREPRRGRAILLVPDSLQRKRLKARLDGVPRVRVHQFYSLANLILRHTDAGIADLSDTLHSMLLRGLLRDLAAAGRLPTFARVAHKSGFVANVGALIAEAQDAEVPPPALATAGVTPYDAELAAIYAEYLVALEQLKLADGARRLALARDALRANPHVLAGLSRLVIDGFDQFTPLQLSLLRELTRHAQRSLITLTGGLDDRPAHRRFARTRAQIVAALQPTIVQMPAVVSQPTTGHRPPLTFLEQHLFDLNAPPPVDADGTLALIAAADREREVRAALRRVRALLQRGAAPEQIALLFRDGTVYVPLLREVAAEYGLPLAVYEGRPLVEAPAVAMFLAMLRLPLEDYPRRVLVEIWRSLKGCPWAQRTEQPLPAAPAVGRNLEHAASLLDSAARAAGVSQGLDRLRSMLAALAAAEPVVADADLDRPTIAPDAAAGVLTSLDAFAAWLTPPEQATIGEYVSWVRAKLLDCSFWMLDLKDINQTADSQNPTFARLAVVLEDLEHAAALLHASPVSYGLFVAELNAAAAAARYGRVEPGPGRVAVLPALVARGMGFEHVVLLGLVEGEFPLKLPDPLFYSRRERTILAQQGIHLTPPDPADERSLFYETIARARQSLTLTRTYLDASGNPLSPSSYLKALLDLVQPGSVSTIRIPAGSVPSLEDAASPQEELIAVMEGRARRMEHGAGNDPVSHCSMLNAQLFEHVQHACEVERVREATGHYGSFEGVIDAPALIAHLAQHFGPGYRWSVTQFNDYITCPFRFVAAHILNLDRRNEPEEGLERAGRGRLYHAILARAGEQWMRMEHAHSTDNEPAILEVLHAAADAVLAEAPIRYGFEPGGFWEWDKDDVRRRLVRAMRRVLQEGKEWAGFRPAGVEQSFGTAGAPPLKLETPAGLVLVAGRVDRIDQRDDRALALIDYKSNSSPRPFEETLNGRDVQLTIYLLAVEQILARGQRVERAAFVHLGSGKRSKALTDNERQAALAAMTARVAEAVAGVRAGYFAVCPRDKCPVGCAYAGICRLNIAKRAAQDQPAEDSSRS